MGIDVGVVWWAWLVLAALAGGFALVMRRLAPLSIAVAAAAAALLALLTVDFVWQLATFAVIAAAGLLLVRLPRRTSSVVAENVYGIERVIGKEAIVVVSIDPTLAQGRVRVEREVWHAATEDGTAVPDGTTVQVVAVTGKRLVVRPLPNEMLPAQEQEWS